MNRRLLSIIAASVLGVTFILYAVANGLPSWGKVKGVDITVGLWKGCVPNPSGGTTCSDIGCNEDEAPEVCKKIIASRAFMTITCIVVPITAILLIVLVVGARMHNATILGALKIMSIFSLLMGIIGVALGGNATTTKEFDDFQLGPAAIIGIVAVIINFAGAVITLLIPSGD